MQDNCDYEYEESEIIEYDYKNEARLFMDDGESDYLNKLDDVWTENSYEAIRESRFEDKLYE
ncbi:MAG: hypothetical protein K0S47_4445 [Herbinix sp.]|jgi:hypothetical protein|nr:hypothetical protein [Herbinix sp.]